MLFMIIFKLKCEKKINSCTDVLQEFYIFFLNSSDWLFRNVKIPVSNIHSRVGMLLLLLLSFVF